MAVSKDTNTMVAIIAIAMIAITAISKNIDGNLLALAIVAMAGLGGFEVYQRSKNGAEGGSE